MRATLSPPDQVSRQRAILAYWLGDELAASPSRDITSRTALEPRFDLWFSGTPSIDADIRSRFQDDVESAINGSYTHWVQQDKMAALALIILLDQFALNIFRSDKKSFEASKLAIPHTNHFISQRWDCDVPLLIKLFAYLPLEHSEVLGDQDTSVRLFTAALDAERAVGSKHVPIAQNLVTYAEEHRHVVAKFGRFPGRNVLYGRPSTADEQDYLKAGGVY